MFSFIISVRKEVIILSVSEQIKILCVKLNISVSELARLYGTSPQAFSQKMKREGFTPAELKKVAEAAGCKYITSFVLPNGDTVSDWSSRSTQTVSLSTVGRFYMYYDIITFYIFCPHRRERTSYCCRFASYAVIVSGSGGLFMFPRVPHFLTSPF